MHCKLKELLIIFSTVPTLFFHHLLKLRKFVRECILRIACVELQTLRLNNIDNLRSKRSRKLTCLAKNHIHCIRVYLPAWLTLKSLHKVHKGCILNILAERSNQWRITQTWPYILNLLEEFDYKVVDAQLRFALISERHIDCAVEALEVCHHRAHHSARKTATYKQR